MFDNSYAGRAGSSAAKSAGLSAILAKILGQDAMPSAKTGGLVGGGAQLLTDAVSGQGNPEGRYTAGALGGAAIGGGLSRMATESSPLVRYLMKIGFPKSKIAALVGTGALAGTALTGLSHASED